MHQSPRRLLSMAVAIAALVVAAPIASPASAATCSYVGAAANSVRPGTTLTAGQSVLSPNGRFAFGVDRTGTLALRDTTTGGRRWIKPGGAGASLVYSSTGAITLRASSGAVVFRALPTAACGEIVVENSGRAAVYSNRALIMTVPNAAGSGRDPSQYPFASSALWNVGVGTGVKFDAVNGSKSRVFLSGKPNVNSAVWSVAVYRATSSDAMATVTDLKKGGVYRLRIPANATATGGSDKHVAIVDPSGTVGYEFYDFTKTGSASWSTTRVTVTDLTGDGLKGGSRASNVSIFAGLIRDQELKNLSIDHALAVAIPSSMLKSGPVWPATMQDTNGASVYSGTIPMGSMVAIPAGIDLEKLGLTPEGLALGRALQNYGAYVLLNSSTVALYAEMSADQNQVKKLRDAWYALYPQMRVVNNSSITSVAGGGVQQQATLANLW